MHEVSIYATVAIFVVLQDYFFRNRDMIYILWLDWMEVLGHMRRLLRVIIALVLVLSFTRISVTLHQVTFVNGRSRILVRVF